MRCLVVFTLIFVAAYSTTVAFAQSNSETITVPTPSVSPARSIPAATPDANVNSNLDEKASETPRSNVLKRIMATDTDTIQIKPENRGNLVSCNASEGEAMLIALHNCWPLLEGFQAYFEAKKISQDHRTARWKLLRDNPDYRASEDYKASEQAEYTDVLRSAKKIEALAGDRIYPMQDMLLFLTNIMKISVAQKQHDYETALVHLDNAIMIFETTRITEPGFATHDRLYKQRERLVERATKTP